MRVQCSTGWAIRPTESRSLCGSYIMHLSFAPGTPRNLGRMVQFWYFFFPCGGGELLSFGNDFAGPRGHTHGICSRQCDRQGEKCLTWYHGRCVKMSKRRAKKLDTFVYFCQWKVWWNGLTMKGWKKVIMLFLTTSNRDYVVGDHTSP